MTTSPQEAAGAADGSDTPVLRDRAEARAIRDQATASPEEGDQTPGDQSTGTAEGADRTAGDDSHDLSALNPEGMEVYDVVVELSRVGGGTTVGAVAEATQFPLPEVQRVLEEMSPTYVEIRGDGPDGTPGVRAR